MRTIHVCEVGSCCCSWLLLFLSNRWNSSKGQAVLLAKFYPLNNQTAHVSMQTELQYCTRLLIILHQYQMHWPKNQRMSAHPSAGTWRAPSPAGGWLAPTAQSQAPGTWWSVSDRRFGPTLWTHPPQCVQQWTAGSEPAQVLKRTASFSRSKSVFCNYSFIRFPVSVGCLCTRVRGAELGIGLCCVKMNLWRWRRRPPCRGAELL